MKSAQLNQPQLFELFSISDKTVKGQILKGKRVIIGRSATCDLVIDDPTVSAIHAVIDFNDNEYSIFDMNSANGTFLNGERIVSSKFKLGDELSFSQIKFIFQNYQKDNLPPLLDILTPEHKTKELPLPPQLDDSQSSVSRKVLPTSPHLSQKDDLSFEKIYPLAADPKANYSEYIFEGLDNLYPIFKYKNSRSLEIIILFEDRIYYCDYFPLENRTLFLSGTPDKGSITFPYLGKKDKVKFIEIINGQVLVHKLSGYKFFNIRNNLTQTSQLNLHEEDLIRFSKGDLQIFSRLTDSPPHVARAPIFRRDKELKRYLVSSFFTIFLFLLIFNMVKVDKERDQEKNPQRVATILYQPPKLIKPKVPKKEIVKIEVKKELEIKPEVVKVEERPKDPSPKPNIAKTETPAAPKTVSPTNFTKVVEAKSAASTAPKQAITQINKAGIIDTYKTPNFTGTVSSLLAKSGGTKINAAQYDSGNIALNSGKGEFKSFNSIPSKADASGDSTQGIGNKLGSGKLDGAGGLKGRGSGRKGPYFDLGMPSNPDVRGSIDPYAINQALKDHLAQFRYCYQGQLDKTKKKFEGSINMNFLIGASGHVTKAGITGNNEMPAVVQNCALNVLRGIQFPIPDGGGVVEVNQVFNFNASL